MSNDIRSAGVGVTQATRIILSMLESGGSAYWPQALEQAKKAIKAFDAALADADKVEPDLLRQLMIAYPGYEADHYATFVKLCRQAGDSPWPQDNERWMSVGDDGEVYAGDYAPFLKKKFEHWLSDGGRFRATWRQTAAREITDAAEIASLGGKPGDVMVEVAITHNRQLAEFTLYVLQMKDLLREALAGLTDSNAIVARLVDIIERNLGGYPSWETLRAVGISRGDEPEAPAFFRDSPRKRAERRGLKSIFRTAAGHVTLRAPETERMDEAAQAKQYADEAKARTHAERARLLGRDSEHELL